MNVEALNCRCCGGVLKVGSALCVCEFCGATNFVSDTAGKYITQLNRANKLRQEKEYDNAIRIYDNILSENVATPDILWLRTLCEYGIEYVPDPVSSKFFPTLHRIKDESILNYHSYLEALELSDDEQKKVLIKEAQEINRIQTDYLEIAQNEDPYDVFICYKETDEDTKEVTEDVKYATKLYELLTASGYKVFFARITLQDKLSVDFEPYIFAALKSSKAMAVIGSKSEYFTATWVKNEWSRFLKLMESDMDKQIFFACDDPNELPRAFSLKQAQMLSDPNAMDNLAKNIKKFLENMAFVKKYGKNRSTSSVSHEKGMYEDALKKVNSGNFAAALSAIADMLEIFPDSADAYWLRLVATLRHTTDNIKYLKRDLSGEEDFKKAVELASEEQKKKYMEIKDICLGNLNLQKEFNAQMDDLAEEYENSLSGNPLYIKRQSIIKELDRLISERDGSKKIDPEIEKEIEKRISQIDSLSRQILEELQKMGIAKYRDFCSSRNISDKVEIDMDADNYTLVRRNIINENKEIKEKYALSVEEFPEEEKRVGKEKSKSDRINSIYRSFIVK